MTMDFDSSNSVKYTLRTKSLLKRLESERSRQGMKKRQPKEKPKPAPLSKYRRKTANARERNRMREINEAFETLQKTLPDLPGVDAEKLTKITVLRLAVNYIKILACVKDSDIIGTKGIDELQKLWCLNNAHMARPEHCVRAVFKASKTSNNQNKPLKVLNCKPKPAKCKPASSCKPGEVAKEKSTSAGKKRPSKSRNRGKVCKTASVATSNGAYITLKNVAFQSNPNRRPYLDTKPLMMSMTVKRPRLEHVSFKKPPKIARYEPPLKSTPKMTSFGINCNCNNFNNFITPYNKTITPLFGTVPFHVVPQNIVSPLEDKYLTNFTIYDVDSPVVKKEVDSPIVKNEIVFDSPKSNRLSSWSSMDSAIFSEESSMPLSPKSLSPKSSPSPPFTPFRGEIAYSTPVFDTVFPSQASSDSDSVLPPAIELDSLLGSEPFEEELEQLTSSFMDTDDALNLFLDHTSSNFICADINSY